MDQVLSGGCLCGEVRYRITAAPVEALYCHCRMCQRAHGAPVIAWLTVPLGAFAVSAGTPAAYRSSAKAFRHFCRACGTPLTWRAAANPQHVDVSIATLDDPEPIEPLLAPLDGEPDRLVRNRRPLAALSDQPAAPAGVLTRGS